MTVEVLLVGAGLGGGVALGVRFVLVLDWVLHLLIIRKTELEFLQLRQQICHCIKVRSVRRVGEN